MAATTRTTAAEFQFVRIFHTPTIWERKCNHLGGQVFKDCSTVNSRSRSNTAMAGRSVLQMSVNTTDRELQNETEHVEGQMNFYSNNMQRKTTER